MDRLLLLCMFAATGTYAIDDLYEPNVDKVSGANANIAFSFRKPNIKERIRSVVMYPYNWYGIKKEEQVRERWLAQRHAEDANDLGQICGAIDRIADNARAFLDYDTNKSVQSKVEISDQSSPYLRPKLEKVSKEDIAYWISRDQERMSYRWNIIYERAKEAYGNIERTKFKAHIASVNEKISCYEQEALLRCSLNKEDKQRMALLDKELRECLRSFKLNGINIKMQKLMEQRDGLQ